MCTGILALQRRSASFDGRSRAQCGTHTASTTRAGARGFSIAYAWEERVYGQVAILKLARKYEQAAVYMYSVDKDTGELVREVLWVDALKHKEHGTKETMQVLKEPPQTPLADPAYWSSSSASEGA